MNATEIVPGLWQSGWPDMGWVRTSGIRRVLNVVPDEQKPCPTYPASVSVHRVPYLDTPGSTPPPWWLDRVSAVIAEHAPRGGLLVHCLAGNNRSTIAICAGLMRMRGCSASKALSVIRARRDVSPAPGWLAGLAAWEKATGGGTG